MRMQITVVFAVVLSSVGAAEDSVDLRLDATLAYGHGTTADTRMHTLLELRPELALTFGERSGFVTSARVRLDADDEIEPGEPEYLNYWPASRPTRLGTAGSVELRDAYLALNVPGGIVRLGKQQIVWGSLDGLKVVDVINPQDFRYFIVEDFNDSRVTLWAVYADFSSGDWRVEFAAVPDGSGHAIPDPGAWFELRAPRFRFGADADAPGLPVSTVAPSGGVDDTGLGLRVTRQVGIAGFSAVAYSGRDPEPLGRIVDGDGAAPRVQRYLERRETLGISADIGLGSVIIRLEHAQHPGRFFNRLDATGLGRVRRDQLRSAAGVDFNGPFGTLVNLQYLDDRIRGDATSLVRPGRDRIATATIRKAIGFDQWVFQGRWYKSISDGDGMVLLRVSHALSPRTSLQFEAAAFRGTRNGLFGQFEDRDIATVRLQHNFR